MNEKWKDYYEILEVEFGCSEEEIKKNYRDLMKKYHPDSKYADEAKAKEVNEAYDTLGDEEQRAKYDATYEQYKNGEFTNQETDEMPKYTHEEMHEAFNEEEIRFAERVALQKVISESLDNAKIIIDAKNELLFAAFNDTYDNITYKDEYHEFCDISGTYINNLYDLISKAENYGLESEINTIEQFINYLKEVIESIPKSLDEAKRSVKLELMREQLQNETQDIIQNAENIRGEFIGLYKKVYEENISKDDFKTYYGILKIGMTDAISQLNKIYDLLKEAKLDDLFEQVGHTIGKLQKDIEVYSGNYDVAYKLGKREHIRQKVEETLLPFTEYKAKMLEIMEGIMTNPEPNNLNILVTKARALSNGFETSLPKFVRKELLDPDFSETSKEHFAKAAEIYIKRTKLHEKLTQIFEKTETVKVEDKDIEVLKEAIDTTKEEFEAIKLFHDAYILLGEHEEYQNLSSSELQRLKNDFEKYQERSQNLLNLVNQMSERVWKVYSAYNNLDINSIMNQVCINRGPNYVKSKHEYYKKLSRKFRALALATLAGILTYGAFYGCPATFIEKAMVTNFEEIPGELHVFHLIVTTICATLPTNIASKIFSHKCKNLEMDLEIYKKLGDIQDVYNNMMNGNDPQLQKIYRFAQEI